MQPANITRTRGARGQQLRREIDAALRGPSPLALLLIASRYVEAITPRALDRHDEEQPVERLPPETFRWFADSVDDLVCLAIAGNVVRPGVLDEHVDTVSRQTIGRVAPQWFAHMDDITVTRVLAWSWPDGPGESMVIESQWPDGATAMVFVSVDLERGASFGEMYAADGTVDDALQAYAEAGFVGLVPVEMEPGAARARIAEVVAMTEFSPADEQCDGWPANRPFVEWLLRHLPEGGRAYERVSWPSYADAHLVDSFMASPFVEGFALGIDEAIDLMELVVEFVQREGSGDPRRWTERDIETLMTAWFPPHIEHVEAYTMFHLPDVLASFVRYSHHRESADESNTNTIVVAIEAYRRPYLEAVLTRLDPDSDEFDTLVDLMLNQSAEPWD